MPERKVMQAYKLDAYIPENHRLEITLPNSFPLCRHKIEIVMVDTEFQPEPQRTNASDIEALLVWQQSLSRRQRSAEDIEAQIAEERNSWGD
jgi:hypothetical protein